MRAPPLQQVACKQFTALELHRLARPNALTAELHRSARPQELTSTQVLRGLDYLHSKLYIIHTDLKPENVMLTTSLRPQWPPDSEPPGKLPAACSAACAWAVLLGAHMIF